MTKLHTNGMNMRPHEANTSKINTPPSSAQKEALKALNILLVYGGSGAEREVSIQSAHGVLEALKNLGMDPAFEDIKNLTEAKDAVQKHTPDLVLCVVHGEFGENGALQALLEEMNVPFVGADSRISRLCAHKDKTKSAWKQIGVPTASYALLKGDVDENAVRRMAVPLGSPLIIKPNTGGSSVGISKIRVLSHDAIVKGYHKAKEADEFNQVLLESFVGGIECTVGVLCGEALPPIAIHTKSEYYDYQAKYISDKTTYEPLALQGAYAQHLQQYVQKSLSAMPLLDWGRIDFILTPQGEMYFLEINTAPGMTSHSLLPMGAKLLGIDYAALVACVLWSASCRFGLIEPSVD